MLFFKRYATAPSLQRFLLHFFIHPVQVRFQRIVNSGGTEPGGRFRPAYPAPAGDMRVWFPPAGNPDAKFIKTLLGTVKSQLQGTGIRGIAFRIQGGIQFSVRHSHNIIRIAYGISAGIIRQFGRKCFIQPWERRLQRPRPQSRLIPFFKNLTGTDTVGKRIQTQVHPALQGLLPENGTDVGHQDG